MRTVLLLAAASILAAAPVKIDTGLVEGTPNSDGSVLIFKSIPFAAPPTGNRRWRAPGPAEPWSGVRKAEEFGSPCVQGNVFGDIAGRGKAMSEDCLSVVISTPAKAASQPLPVYLWFYGGGFAAGSADEARYDGESFAKRGIVVVNANYRLGVFGFLEHPELTRESPHHSSGNYGLLDQVAALRWVRKNIAAFGGDPNRITIGGESAGSLSVSALMASPLSRGLFQQAIGESGAFFGAVGGHALLSLAEAEQQGLAFADSVGAKSLADLRAKPSAGLLAVSMKKNNGMSFWPIVDGYFLPSDVPSIYAKDQQAQVPLLAGWNADEIRMSVMLAKEKPTAKTFSDRLHQQFKDKADAAAKLYPASTDEEAFKSAGDLASDLFIVYGTWKWIDTQAKTGKPVYRYRFDRAVPIPEAMKGTGLKTFGAAHAAELEYVFQKLDSKKADWQPEDDKVAETMNRYWSNFIKTGDPNGEGLAPWPDFGKTHEVMHLDVQSHAQQEQYRDRYAFLESAGGN